MDVPHKTVIVDKQRVQQVCMNLLSNACKFTEDGDIQVNAWFMDEAETTEQETPKVDGEVRPRDGRGRLYISVKDSGCGIA